nr:WG repeat-containing protein [uncultured Psychroserpens sp.]
MTDNYLEKFYEQSLNQPIPYRKGNLWGYSNVFGDIVIEPQYEQVAFFYQTDLNDLDSYRALVKSHNRFFIVNNHNARLSENYKKIVVIDPYDIEFVFFKIHSNEDKVGVFFKDKIIIEPIYDELDNDNKYIKVRLNDKYGIIDHEGTQIISTKYDSIESIIDEDSGIINKWEATLNGSTVSYSAINKTGTHITVDEIINDDFINQITIHIRKEKDIIERISDNNKQGAILLKSKKTINPEYDSIEVAYKLKYEKPAQVKDYNAVNRKVLFIVEKEGKFGIIDEDSNIILSIEMDEITNNGYDIFELKRNDQVGRYNQPKKALFFTNYDDISYEESIEFNDSEDYRIYKIKNKNGMFDYIGENGIKYYED